MKILLIEDEVKTVAYLQRGLTEQGCIVDVANNGIDGQHLALTGDYDAIVLDIMLPVSYTHLTLPTSDLV